MATFNADGTPELTDEQRAAAIAKAAEARHNRAELLRKVKAGEVRPEDVLKRRDDLVKKTRVLRFIESWPGVGKQTAEAHGGLPHREGAPHRRARPEASRSHDGVAGEARREGEGR